MASGFVMSEAALPKAEAVQSQLPPELLEQVLAKLSLEKRPDPTLPGLSTLYAAWCQRVPFDNIRKVIHIREGNPAPLPGTEPTDYLEAWLKHGTGGTCWSGAGALYALLISLGFNASRGLATMLVAPDLPPNHGTVQVKFGESAYLLDSSILHGEPLPLKMDGETGIVDKAWSVKCVRKNDRWHIFWRPLHKPGGIECRLERFGATAEEYRQLYEATRAWSPFNYAATARLNRGEEVVGVAFGSVVAFRPNCTITRTEVPACDRMRVLIEQIGLSEEIVNRLPQDMPTPPPAKRLDSMGS